MSKLIRKLTTNEGRVFYPATITDAILCADLKVCLSNLIYEFNLSLLFPNEGIDYTNKYDIDTAISLIDKNLKDSAKFSGIKLTFLNNENNLEFWTFVGKNIDEFKLKDYWKLENFIEDKDLPKKDTLDYIRGIDEEGNPVLIGKFELISLINDLNLGYFETEEELKKKYPIVENETIAYVGSNYPYEIWIYKNEWTFSGNYGGQKDLNLDNYYKKSEVDKLILQKNSITPILQTAPDINTKTWTDEETGEIFDFNVGQFAKILSNEVETGSILYQFYGLNEQDEAIWVKTNSININNSLVTLPEAPNENTLTWFDGSENVKFKIGQLARVDSGTISTGFIYYRLYDIKDETIAIWKKTDIEYDTVTLSKEPNSSNLTWTDGIITNKFYIGQTVRVFNSTLNSYLFYTLIDINNGRAVWERQVGKLFPDIYNGEIFNDYENNVAGGEYSHAEGYNTKAIGNASHAEGNETIAEGTGSHAEGFECTSIGEGAHSEGIYTKAIGNYSHAEGRKTTSSGNNSHSEGINSIAKGESSHSEGNETVAEGDSSHSEGKETIASGEASHSEGLGGYEKDGKYNYIGAGGSYGMGYANITKVDSTWAILTDTGCKADWGYGNTRWLSVGDRCDAVFNKSDGVKNKIVTISNIQTGQTYSISIQEDLSDIFPEYAGQPIKIDSVYFYRFLKFCSNGLASHTEGICNTAYQSGEHAEGVYNMSYNSTDDDKRVIHSVGIGSLSSRKNAHEIKFNGDHYVYSLGNYDGTNSEIAKTLQEVINEKPGKIVSTSTKGEIFNDYENNVALGAYSHSEGKSTTANGQFSHAEGFDTIANENGSHAEGGGTLANEVCSHAEGENTSANGRASHAEGSETTASGDYSHAEGSRSTTSSDYSHAEGNSTKAQGQSSHAEGSGTTASGDYSHAEGSGTTASGESSHAEGSDTTASGEASHAEGKNTIASGDYSHAEGNSTKAQGQSSHAEGSSTTASGKYSHAEGKSTIASGEASHAEGSGTTASSYYAHAEGDSSVANGNSAHAEGYCTFATDYSHSEGYFTMANGNNSHAEGNYTVANGYNSHAEGRNKSLIDFVNISVSGNKMIYDDIDSGSINSLSIDESYFITGDDGTIGIRTIKEISESTKSITFNENIESDLYAGYMYIYKLNSTGNYSHSEGNSTTASGEASHAEGSGTTASGEAAHAEGSGTTASGEAAHSEGKNTIASGDYSHAEGYGDSDTTEKLVLTLTSGRIEIDSDNIIRGFNNSSTVFSKLQIGKIYSFELKRVYPPVGEIRRGYRQILGHNTTSNYFSFNQDLTNICGTNVMTFSESNPLKIYEIMHDSSGYSSHVGGRNSVSSGNYSFAHGQSCLASGDWSHSEGWGCTAEGNLSTVFGQQNISFYDCQTIIGKFNKPASKDLFQIGYGTSYETANRLNIFTVTKDGAVSAKGAFTGNTTADYAEMFEWEDGNPNNEERIGYFVSLINGKIEKSTSNSKYILGIISVTPIVLGDNPMDWHNKYLRDDWGRTIYEDIEVIDEITKKSKIEKHPKINPEYDSEKEYIERFNRPEWGAVGLIGKLRVRQDGTLSIGKFCKPNDNGIATLSNDESGYYVLDIINDSIALVLFK